MPNVALIKLFDYFYTFTEWQSLVFSSFQSAFAGNTAALTNIVCIVPDFVSASLSISFFFVHSWLFPFPRYVVHILFLAKGVVDCSNGPVWSLETKRITVLTDLFYTSAKLKGLFVRYRIDFPSLIDSKLIA